MPRASVQRVADERDHAADEQDGDPDELERPDDVGHESLEAQVHGWTLPRTHPLSV